MGLTAETKTNKTFLKIVNGKLTQGLKSKTETSVERTTDKGEVVHENRFGALQGWIYGVRIDESGDYGNQLIVDVTDKGDNYQIQVSLKSSYAHDFLSRIESVDFTKHVALNPYKIAREDNKEKFNQLFVIKQEGVNVAKRYTKENPNGLPAAQKKKEGKIDVWDFTDVNNFYYEIAQKMNKKIEAMKSEIILASQE